MSHSYRCVLFFLLGVLMGAVVCVTLVRTITNKELRAPYSILTKSLVDCEMEIPRKYQCKLEAKPDIPPPVIEITQKDADGKLTPPKGK